jgi:acetyl-CoA C-acetyltransferase
MTDAYIYEHVRSPRGRGRSDGSLHDVAPIELISQILQALGRRVDLPTERLDDVILGCVTAIGEQGANIARTAVLYAGFDESVPGQQINRFCASGLEAVNLGAACVMSGQATLVVAGGVESMSRVAMASDGGAWPLNPQVAFKTHFVPQGISADLIATRYGFSREDLDAYALESQRRAAAAWAAGYFEGSVVTIRDRLGQPLLDRDEHMRPGTTLEGLAELQPAFALMGEQAGFDAVAIQRYPDVEVIEHRHTSGNSSGIVDGAAALLIGSREAGRSLDLRPRARIRSFASTGTEPTIMLTGPGPAARKALGLAGLQAADIDLFEVNEAFAAVVLRFMQELDVPHDRVNVNGGAIALGHPLGATGAIILGTALDELERRDGEFALVTLCVGAGMGTATILQRV